ncbi:SulP family inorganic anion transporter [Actinomadura madurae]|uniref:SulP family inorganic anion transporter n=1 Tax=Actinomadura madurae TaxID=1993 RepID=UPI0035589FF2
MTSRPGWGEGTRAHRTNPVTSCCTRPKTPGCRSSESAAWDRPTIFPTSRHLGHRQWSRGTGPELETARLPSASALCCGRCDREVAGVQPVVSGYRGTARIPPSLAGRGRGGGITVTAYLVPQVMAYAGLAGLQPIAGLWAMAPAILL